MNNEIQELKEKIDKLTEFKTKVEKYIAVIISLAIIFGIGGGFGAAFIKKARDNISALNKDLKNAKEKIIKPLLVDAETKIKEFVENEKSRVLGQIEIVKGYSKILESNNNLAQEQLNISKESYIIISAIAWGRVNTKGKNNEAEHGVGISIDGEPRGGDKDYIIGEGDLFFYSSASCIQKLPPKDEPYIIEAKCHGYKSEENYGVRLSYIVIPKYLQIK